MNRRRSPGEQGALGVLETGLTSPFLRHRKGTFEQRLEGRGCLATLLLRDAQPREGIRRRSTQAGRAGPRLTREGARRGAQSARSGRRDGDQQETKSWGHSGTRPRVPCRSLKGPWSLGQRAAMGRWEVLSFWIRCEHGANWICRWLSSFLEGRDSVCLGSRCCLPRTIPGPQVAFHE